MDIGSLTGSITLEDQLSPVLYKVSAAMNTTQAASTTMEHSILKVGTIATFVGNQLDHLVSWIISFGKSVYDASIMAGARLEQLAIVSVYLGERAGYSAEFINSLSAKIEKSGITATESRDAIVKLVKAHVDLDNAAKLSALAQNMAVISGRSSSDTYGMMIHGIETLNSQVLRQAGFTTNMDHVLSEYTRTMHKSADALTMNEKQGLLVNAMLKEGADVADLYSLSMGTAAKQAGSADRVWKQVGETLGTILLPVTNLVIKSWYELGTKVRDSLKDVAASVSPTFVALGAKAKIFVDQIGEMAAAALPKIVSAVKAFVAYLVDLNERFHVTDNLVKGVRFAWDLLQKAFGLVEFAVHKVIAAWSAMPDWLKRITKGALETSAVLAIYGLALNAGVSAMGVFFGKLDTGINLLANFATSIALTITMWPQWINLLTIVTARYELMSRAIINNTLIMELSNVAVRATTYARTAYVGMLVASSNAVATLAVRTGLLTTIESLGAGAVKLVTGSRTALLAILAFTTEATTTLLVRTGLLTTVETLSAYGTRILAVAKGQLSFVIGVLSLSYNQLIARLGITSLALTATTVATRLQTGAMTALGFVLLGIQAIPLIALLTALAFAMYKLAEATLNLIKVWWSGGAQAVWAMLWMVDRNNFAAKWYDAAAGTKALAGGLDEAAIAAKLLAEEQQRLEDSMSGKAATDQLTKLQLAYDRLSKSGSVSAEVAKRFADQIRNLEAQGGKATPALEALRKKFDDLATAAEKKAAQDEKDRLASAAAMELAKQHTKAVTDLTTSYREGDRSLSVITDAFNRLTPAQRANHDVIRRIVPDILKLDAAYITLTDTQRAVLDSSTKIRIDHTKSAVETLQLMGVTQRVIDTQLREGKTLEELARQYSSNSAGIRILTEDIKALTEAEDLRKKTRDEALAKAAKEAAVDRIPSTLYQGLRDANAEAAQQATETDIETTVRLIKKANEDILSSTRATGEARIKIEGEVAVKQKRELDAVLIDQDKLKKSTVAYLEEQLKMATLTYDTMMKDSKKYTDAAKRDALDVKNAATDALKDQKVNWDALRVSSQTNLKRIAEAARATYLEAAKAGSDQSAQAIENYKKQADAADRAFLHIKSTFDKVHDAMGSVADILDNIPGKYTQLAVVAARTGQKMMEAFANQDWIGMIVAGVTGLITLFGKLFGLLNEGRKKIKEFADSFDTLAPGTGFDELRDKLVSSGMEREWIQLTQTIANSDLKGAELEIKRIKAALDALDKDIQHYNLTWTDLLNKQAAGTKVGADLVVSFRRLTLAGYDEDKIIKAMGGDLNQFIINSIRAGTKIPEALEPIIQKLIRTGQLTDAAARAMLGLAEDTMPSLADIKEAADRYGLSLDALGPKVQQLSISESANQIVKDFNLLTLAGADFNVIMGGTSGKISAAEAAMNLLKAKGGETAAVGSALWDEYRHAVEAWKAEVGAGGDAVASMGTQIQSLVTKALKAGLELPEAMRPIIQKMIDAGQLTDEFGEALTDTTKLKFAVDLNKMFQTLIEKLDTLIDKITNGVGGALNGLGNMEVRPTVKPRYDYSDLPPGYTGGDGGEDSGHFATGGIVPSYYGLGSNVIRFTPRGTDTVPAMLTPGERVLTVPQTRAYDAAPTQRPAEAPSGPTVIFKRGAFEGMVVDSDERIEYLADEIVTRISKGGKLQTKARAAIKVA